MNLEENYLDITVSNEQFIDPYTISCKKLISAIITQAIEDSLVWYPSSTEALRAKSSALNFIDQKNKVFEIYCGLIDFDHIWLAEKFKKIFKHNQDIKKQAESICAIMQSFFCMNLYLSSTVLTQFKKVIKCIHKRLESN
jgi:hypothetical protein